MVIFLNSLGTVLLNTNRCILRRFEISDYIDVFRAYLCDENVSKYLCNEPHKNILETRFLLNDFINNYNNLNYYNWLIINKGNKDIVGTVSLHEIDLFNEKLLKNPVLVAEQWMIIDEEKIDEVKEKITEKEADLLLVFSPDFDKKVNVL